MCGVLVRVEADLGAYYNQSAFSQTGCRDFRVLAQHIVLCAYVMLLNRWISVLQRRVYNGQPIPCAEKLITETQEEYAVPSMLAMSVRVNLLTTDYKKHNTTIHTVC